MLNGGRRQMSGGEENPTEKELIEKAIELVSS